jgi:hypothetical protein
MRCEISGPEHRHFDDAQPGQRCRLCHAG